MNKRKSATNCNVCGDKAIVMDIAEGYKYLGITENRNSEVTKKLEKGSKGKY